MVGVSIRYANRSAWLNILVAKLFCGHVDRERERVRLLFTIRTTP
jgi:hypothetical protein